MTISIILAVSQNGVIGDKGGIPWHLPNDFKHFKELTLGGTIVMGRKTWDSLPKKPLPGRKNVVLTRNQDFTYPGVTVIHRFEDMLKDKDKEDIWVIGGQEIYKQALLFADRVELTIVRKEVQGDTFFLDAFKPSWNIAWEITNIRKFVPDETHECPYEFVSYKRKQFTDPRTQIVTGA